MTDAIEKFIIPEDVMQPKLIAILGSGKCKNSMTAVCY